MEVRTGSVDVNDEIIPEDDSENEVSDGITSAVKKAHV